MASIWIVMVSEDATYLFAVDAQKRKCIVYLFPCKGGRLIGLVDVFTLTSTAQCPMHRWKRNAIYYKRSVNVTMIHLIDIPSWCNNTFFFFSPPFFFVSHYIYSLLNYICWDHMLAAQTQFLLTKHPIENRCHQNYSSFLLVSFWKHMIFFSRTIKFCSNCFTTQYILSPIAAVETGC